MNTITKNCLYCKNEFEASLKEHRRGNAKFCCLKCSSDHRKANKTEPEPNCACSTCSNMFYRSPSKQRTGKHGYQFCSRSCKEAAQRLDNPDHIAAIMPDHYGTGSSEYRAIAFRKKAMICEDCGFDRVPEVLEVHHIDRDRNNNDIANLRVLCPTCHVIDHYINKDGRFTGRKNGGG